MMGPLSDTVKTRRLLTASLSNFISIISALILISIQRTLMPILQVIRVKVEANFRDVLIQL
jgi:hypothetical protein